MYFMFDLILPLFKKSHLIVPECCIWPSRRQLILASVSKSGLMADQTAIHLAPNLGACTGTPLGDPIEVGALGQALPAPIGTQTSIAMGSVKAVFGHTEGAAGLTGLLLAHGQLVAACQPSVMHLRGLNPYVQAALQDWRKSHSAQAVIQRQTGPAIAGAAAGTSSFGMSGINAHVILTPGHFSETGAGKTEAAWRRTRCWPRPEAMALLASATAFQGTVHFICPLQTARMAHLRDYLASSTNRVIKIFSLMRQTVIASVICTICAINPSGFQC